MSKPQVAVNWLFAARWILANLVGTCIATLGFYITQGLMIRLGAMNHPFSIIDTVVFYAVLFTIWGIPLWLAQAYVLRNLLSQLGWWIRVSVIGAAVGWSLGVLSIYVLQGLSIFEPAIPICGGVGGLSIGMAQTLVLPRHDRQVLWWPLANAVGWGIGIAVSYRISLEPIRSEAVGVILILAMGVVCGAIVGAVTALTLTHLLLRPMRTQTA